MHGGDIWSAIGNRVADKAVDKGFDLLNQHLSGGRLNDKHLTATGGDIWSAIGNRVADKAVDKGFDLLSQHLGAGIFEGAHKHLLKKGMPFDVIHHHITRHINKFVPDLSDHIEGIEKEDIYELGKHIGKKIAPHIHKVSTGGDIWGDIGNAFKPGREVEQIGRPIASTLIHEGIPIVAGATLGAAGEAAAGPVGGIAGDVIGTRLGKMGADKLGEATGYGIKKRKRGRPRKEIQQVEIVRRRGRPRKTIKKVEVVHRLPYEHYSHPINDSFRQMIDARNRQEQQNLNRNISDMAKYIRDDMENVKKEMGRLEYERNFWKDAGGFAGLGIKKMPEIHIDIGSHNASSKGKSSMTGGRLNDKHLTATKGRFKKGSIEAKEWGKKMREAREAKK